MFGRAERDQLMIGLGISSSNNRLSRRVFPLCRAGYIALMVNRLWRRKIRARAYGGRSHVRPVSL